MKKYVFVVLTFFLSFPILAEPARFKGLAVGAYGTGDFMLGDYADVAKGDAGGGLLLEYTILNFEKIDFGGSVRAEFFHIFPKSDSALKSENDFAFTGGVFLRVPFGQFAFQSEFAYGALIRLANGEDGSDKNGTYIDQIIRVATGLRWNPSFTRNLEIELAPTFSLIPEDKHLLLEAGGRLGAIWHFGK